jgi:hypothetical protein
VSRTVILAGVLVLIFFLTGIAAGISTVIAMSARRAREPGEPDWAPGEDDDWEQRTTRSWTTVPAPRPPIVSWPS